jgi:membrane protease YdiL (CAAX protease family)
MNLMPRALSGLRITLILLWVCGTVAAVLYAHNQNIPARIVIAALPALLVESSLYIATGFAGVRSRLTAVGDSLPLVLVASAALPYTLMTLGFGTFRFQSVLIVAGLAAVAAFWFRVTPRHTAFDLLFLVLMAAVFLSGIFPGIYKNPAGKPQLDILGRLMWIRLGLSVILIDRGAEKMDFGFLPRLREWIAGARYFLYSLPLIVPLALLTGFVGRPVSSLSAKLALTALATFLGMLWVVALAEEFFFRGLLQQWMVKLTGSRAAGLAVASLAFGAAHLGFRAFPNWKFALIATVAGVFYGLAFMRSGSIRASMVTHALLATCWRVFFV